MQVIDSPAAQTVSHNTAAVLCDAKPKLLRDAVREACAVRHFSPRTFDAYWHWIKLFVHWSGRRSPREMGRVEVGQFLSWLATERKVSASTQRQALSAILFLYQQTLQQKIGWVDDIVRAKQPKRIPVVLTIEETRALLSHTSGTPGLFLSLLYGTGMRLSEGQHLRVKDLELDELRIIVRSGKGDKDRVTMVPQSLIPQLRELLEQRRRWHHLDLSAQRITVWKLSHEH